MCITAIPPIESGCKAIRSQIGLPGRLAMWALLGVCMAGCTASKLALAPTDWPPLPGDTLEVRLDFDGAADLDLHVTGPDLETVYFGNSPSRSGGRLDRDVRCESPGEIEGAERGESIRYDAPMPGRYRVGVDYVKGCRRFGSEADYTLHVIGPGLELESSGRIGTGRFDHTALEFDWPPTAGDGR